MMGWIVVVLRVRTRLELRLDGGVGVGRRWSSVMMVLSGVVTRMLEGRGPAYMVGGCLVSRSEIM